MQQERIRETTGTSKKKKQDTKIIETKGINIMTEAKGKLIFDQKAIEAAVERKLRKNK